MKKLAQIFIVLLLIASCAEEPTPVVDSVGGVIGTGEVNPSETIEKDAIIFKGNGTIDGQECVLAISVFEDEGQKRFLTKLDYILHGSKLPDLATDLYKYEFFTNTFSDSETGQGNITFAGAIRTQNQSSDVNALPSYESDGSLVYFLRIETFAADAKDFAAAIENVVNDPSQLAANEFEIDQVDTAVFKVAHAGHYDASQCENLFLEEVKKVEFKLNQ